MGLSREYTACDDAALTADGRCALRVSQFSFLIFIDIIHINKKILGSSVLFKSVKGSGDQNSWRLADMRNGGNVNLIFPFWFAVSVHSRRVSGHPESSEAEAGSGIHQQPNGWRRPKGRRVYMLEKWVPI